MTRERRLAAVMFTDIEGYTALMSSDEDLALSRLDRYTAVLRGQHGAFGGTLVKFLGDGSLSIFDSAIDAVECAVGIQRALGDAPEVPVRVGIHVGDVVVDSSDVFGAVVNIASRIESFGVAGSILVSDAVAEQIRGRADCVLTDMGRFRLKNVGRPVTLHAVGAEGICVPAPEALRGKGDRVLGLPDNLPEPDTAVIGRDADLATLRDLVDDHRLVTITGPGGVGKTRTAIELCRRVAADFEDGVSHVSLADVHDPGEVVAMIADVVDVKEAEGRTAADGLTSLIADRTALLLLDNFEHVIGAAADVAGLLAECPGLKLVVTSRAPLRISAEHEHRLAPLALPAVGETAVAEISACPSVALFVQRAGTASPGFELDGGSVGSVVEICRRLDGLPLAIELAAARTRLLSPDDLVSRLGSALDVLTGGRRDLPERHQTLRAAVGWSHSLLTDSEQVLFRRLAVFPAGATLEAVEEVCAGGQGDVLDDLTSLVDNALVVVDADRFSQLQTIKEFAAERLDGADERTALADRHARFYAELATHIGTGIASASQLAWMERGMIEEANILAALDHLTGRGRRGDSEAVELASAAHGSLWMYWHIRGKHLSARDNARALLSTAEDPLARARLLNTAGISCWTLRDNDQALLDWTESFRLVESAGDRLVMADAIVGLTVANIGVDLDEAKAWAARGVQICSETGYEFGLSLLLTFDGVLHAITGDVEIAEARYREALAIQDSRGDHEGSGLSLGGLAQLAAGRGDTDTALDLYERSRLAFAAVGDRAEEARVLGEMAWTQLAHESPGTARDGFLASAQAYEDVGSTPGIGTSMIGLAAVEAVDGRAREALAIAIAAERFSKEEGIVNVYSDDSPGREYLDAAREAASDEAVAEAERQGATLSVREAIRLAGG